MSCPTGFTASATMASSLMPTAPPISHWPAGSLAHLTQPHRAARAMTPTVVKQRNSGTLVLPAAGGWSSSRPLNPVASPVTGPRHQSASTARDQYATVAIPHHYTAPTPTSHRRRQRAVNGSRQRPSTAKAQTTQCDITVSVAPAVLKPTVAALAQPPFPLESEKSDQTPALNLHSLTPPPVRTPSAVSSLEAFRTPASVHPLAPAPGRHPKTLNEAGCLIADKPMAAYSRQCEPALATEHHRALRFWNDEVLGNLDDIRGTVADEPGAWIRSFGRWISTVRPSRRPPAFGFVQKIHPGPALIVFPAKVLCPGRLWRSSAGALWPRHRNRVRL